MSAKWEIHKWSVMKKNKYGCHNVKTDMTAK